MTGSRLNVPLALRRIAQGFWFDFAPIVTLGFGMVTLPGIIGALVPPASSGGTVMAVVSGLLAALFVTIVSHGVVARLAGKPLDAGAFVSQGIVASPPGFSVALLIGAFTVLIAIIGLLGALAWPPARTIAIATGAVLVLMLLPAMPAALAERLPPLVALQRGLEMTRGARSAIVVIALIAIFTFGPTWLLLEALVRNIEPGAAPSFASPGLWLRALYALIASSVAAVVPGVIYVGLLEPRR
ncbi:hypothetical protein [Glacieibacterium sp.]|uniref:hypothetical protein n=1 Tax=Glacieibacterium sp. TaxID=2860237 RepID=UPI003B00F817